MVYTKRWVVELLLDLAGYLSKNNLADSIAVEPAAGAGAFLGPMIERLITSCLNFGRPLSVCRDSLVAYEVDTESADRARSLVTSTLTGRGVPRELTEELASAWVRTGDYLFQASNFQADFVIGNPPYVRLEDIPQEAAMLYRNAYTTMRGRADLYIGFFEAALRQLKEGGVCAFICADRWMRNQYGAALRELVTSEFSVDIVIQMHDADAFLDDVSAYPAITIIRRQDQGSTVVAVAGREAEDASRATPGVLPESTDRNTCLSLPGGFRTAVVDKWFKGGDPWPCHSPEQLTLLRKLEDDFPSLESYAKVGIGVATGNDAVFLTKDTDIVEKSRLLKLALAGDIWEGALRWSGHYLVDPWDEKGLVSLHLYPRLRAYLEMHEAALRKRHTATRHVRGWYKTIDRVTHSLTATPKLYIADIKSMLDPVLDPGGTYPHHNLYYVQSDIWDLEVLGGLLMSAMGQFFVESYCVRMRGGYLRFQAQYLRRVRVPDPKTVSPVQSDELRTAFRVRDRKRATRVALEIYGVKDRDLEAAL